MKKALFLFAALFCFGVTNAQAPDSVSTIQEPLPSLPEYAYSEILSSSLPSYNGDKVLFDFGQPTRAWSYNWLLGSKGQKIIFNSGIEALNYMVRRGWEFVQAYISGEKGQTTHYLLRIQTSRLTEAQRQQLLTEPRNKSGEEK